MKTYRVLLIAAVLILFSACQTNESVSTLPTEFTEQFPTELIETEPVSTNPITEPTEPSTEPDLSIAVEPGAHCGVATDDTTGDYLEYFLFVPEDAVQDMPLIVFLHGDGEAGNLASLETNVLITKLQEFYGDNYPFIVLAPCTRTASWIKGTIPSTLKFLIDEIVTECEIDPNRIILTGFSRGSIGVWHMISAYGDYFSAAVPVSCGNETALNLDNCVKVPILAFAGSGDENEWMYYNAMNNNVLRIQQAGGNAEMILLSGLMHPQTPYEAYSMDTFRWMLEQ